MGSGLLAHEMRLELRGREALIGTLIVGFLVVLVAALGLEGRIDATILGPALVWIALTFGAQVGLARGFLAEHDGGTLELLRMAGASPFRILLSKATANLVVTLISALLVIPTIALVFNEPNILTLVGALPLLLLGAVGLSLVTTLMSAIAYRARAWSILVPLLGLPLLFPVLASAMNGTRDVAAGRLADAWPETSLIFLYDVAYLVAAWVLADHLLEE